MPRGRSRGAEETLARHKESREKLSAATQGLDDCGHASNGQYWRGCRCDACKAARAERDRERYRRKAEESFGAPTKYVDAGPVRKRIIDLLDEGYTEKEIERLSGIKRQHQYQILVKNRLTGRPAAKVSRKTKDAIFGIPRGRRSLAMGQIVTSEWMTGWLREYTDAGMSIAQISRITGIDRQVFDGLVHGRRSSCRARTLRAFVLAKPALDRELEARKEAKRGWSRRA